MAKVQFERRQSVDPAVAELLGDARRRETERSLPLKERQRKAAARKKDAQRVRSTWDMPETVVETVARLAQQKGCPASQVAEVLLRSALAMVDAGEWRIDDYPSQASKSPRYEVNLLIEEMLNERG